jgi:2-oxopent-4-enoate/cis-2-oxohex-4-enoate hydratase
MGGMLNHDAIAESLFQARIKAQPIAPLSETYPEISILDAYQISHLGFQMRLKTGVKSMGRKIGLTSLAVQKQLGVHQPDFGYITSDMLVNHEGAIGANSLIAGRVEGEVAFVLGRDLKGPGVDWKQVVAATDHVLGCIEIIDSRVRDWKIGIQDTIADNASSAMIVLGNHPKKLSDIDLEMAGMALRLNGEVESTGVGVACLGHPIHAVAWLANTLGALGYTLSAGDIILSGAYGPVVPFKPGDHCEVEISGLGKIRCSRENLL